LATVGYVATFGYVLATNWLQIWLRPAGSF
jgi:hypothetical protein